MKAISYRNRHFPPSIIQRAVWLYTRFNLSLRDVEELLAERGAQVSYETIRRWVMKFGPEVARRLSCDRPRPHPLWHLDEMYVSIGGRWMYLWRAIDQNGEVLDVLVQAKRDKRAALKLMRKLLKKYGLAPRTIVTDKWRAYAAAIRHLGLMAWHLSLLFISSGPPTDSSPPVAKRFSSRKRQGVFRRRRLDLSACHW